MSDRKLPTVYQSRTLGNFFVADMSSLALVPRTRKTRPVLDRGRVASRLSATLQWLTDSHTPAADENIELLLITWHSLTIVDRFSKVEIAAQELLDQAIRRSAPRSTMVCGGPQIWWLLNSTNQPIKIGLFRNRIVRAVTSQKKRNPLLDNLADSLIIQRIGKWHGATGEIAHGLSGIFADMAAGQSLLNNFGLPFERQHSSVTQKSSKTRPKLLTQSRMTDHRRGTKSTKTSTKAQSQGSAWIAQPKLGAIGLWHPLPCYQRLALHSIA